MATNERASSAGPTVSTNLFVDDEIALRVAGAAFDAALAPFGQYAVLAGAHAIHGDIREAERFAEMLRREIPNDLERSAYPGTFYRLAESLAAIQRFDGPAARAQLDEIVYDRRTREHWSIFARVDALASLVEGQPRAGLARLDAFTVLNRGGATAEVRATLAPARALLHLALREVHAARMILQRDLPDGDQAKVHRARIALVLGNTESVLRELSGMSHARIPPRLLSQAAVLKAAASIRGRAHPGDAEVIDRMAGVLEQTGQPFALALLPRKDFDRLRDAAVGSRVDRMFALPGMRPMLTACGVDQSLTPRELAVLTVLTKVTSAAEIARRLSVSPNTVKSQLRSIYRKLEAKNRDEAIAIAVSRHLLPRA